MKCLWPYVLLAAVVVFDVWALSFIAGIDHARRRSRRAK